MFEAKASEAIVESSGMWALRMLCLIQMLNHNDDIMIIIVILIIVASVSLIKLTFKLKVTPTNDYNTPHPQTRHP